MDYIHYFDTETNHNSVYKSSAYTEPWVAYIEENKECTYNKIKQYLIGTAIDEFTPGSGPFSAYTFTSPTFKVEYTGGTLTDLSNAFYEKNELSSITESTLNTSKVTDMTWTLGNCRSLTDISGLNSWNTSNVTSMFNMFCDDYSLTDVSGLKSWDTSNVTNMNGMFYDCTSLTTVDLSKWNTSNVTDMNGMFNGCRNLTTLDLSNFDTSKVTDMKYMFWGCEKLTTVKVTNCSSGETGTQNKILSQLQSDLTNYSWTLTDGVITRSNK